MVRRSLRLNPGLAAAVAPVVVAPVRAKKSRAGKKRRSGGSGSGLMVLAAHRRKKYPGCFQAGVGKGKFWFCKTAGRGERCHKSKSKWWPREGRCVYKD